MDGRVSTYGIAWLLIGLTLVAGIAIVSAANPIRIAAALLLVYALGYVPGSLLLAPRDDRASLSLAVVRLLAGLFLTTVAFLLSLLLAVPWYIGPVVVVAAAVAIQRRSALALCRPHWTATRAGVVAGLLGTILIAPIVIGSLRMAPGPFAPVFFNVDTPYFLEKVHALTRADAYPPPSLGVAGGLMPYHYGAQGLSAMIARGSGLTPHHVVFLIVLPLFAVGMVAASVDLARTVSPRIPMWASVPLLLTPAPTLWYPFWADLGPALLASLADGSIGPLDNVTASFERWGVTLNPGTNVASAFIVLATLAGLAATPVRGWRLPAFFVGSAVLFKVPTGIALCAGLAAFLGSAAFTSRRIRMLAPGLAPAAIFAAMYGAFFVLPGASSRSGVVEPAWLFHQRVLLERDGLGGFWLDMGWLILPVMVLVVVRAGHVRRDAMTVSLPVLGFALAPLLLVNAFRLVDRRPGGDVVTDDWLQLLVPAACAVHAFVLLLAGRSWTELRERGRLAFLAAVMIAVLPSTFVAARYARVLIMSPTSGHEFVDNRPIAAALSAIPVDRTLIVTNDLRYPAEGFTRDNRQLQIPALFGHRAFAVNFRYEHYAFSDERRAAQELLQSAEWSTAIDEAAARYGWTHLLIRNDSAHPRAIPLPKQFESRAYSVFRFDTGVGAPSPAASR